MNIVWFDEATEELEEIYRFYFPKSPTAAIKIYNSIIDEVQILENHPYIAAIEPCLKRNTFRSLVSKNGLFKIIYYVDAETIYITRVWCCRADPNKLRL